MRRLGLLTALVLVAALGAGSTATAAPKARASGPCAATRHAGSRWRHVVWIWMENHSYDQTVGSGDAPYLNATLVRSCGLATNYHNVSHPSLPNYVAATSGGTQGISSDCSPSSCPTAAASIFSQAAAAGLTWRGYDESMPGPCSRSDAGRYAPKHNPAVYYSRLRASCGRADLPLTALSGDLATGRLPAFAFVTPDLCSDTHDCPVATGDAWLRTWIGRLTASRAYRQGSTAIFLTWDEGEGGSTSDCALNRTDPGCHVPLVVIAPGVRPGLRSARLANHYSLLRATEDMLGLGHLGHATDPSSAGLRRAFGL
jgi:phospholipase C